MKKLLSVLACALVLMSIFVSCDSSLSSGSSSELTEVKFIPNLLSGKSLTVQDSPSIAWLEYQATPQYSNESAVISGSVTGNEWKRISQKDTGAETFSTGAVFTQGYWTFSIRVGSGTGEDSVTYYTGSASCYLSGSSKSISVDMSPSYNADATGTLKLTLSTPKLSNEAGSFTVKIYDSTFTDLVTTVKEGSTVLDFTSYTVSATVSNNYDATMDKTYTLTPGIYFLEVQYTSSGASTEKVVVAFKIIEGCQSVISGSIENGAYVSTTIGLEYFSGTLSGPTDNVLTFSPKTTYPGTISYMWFVNGTKQNTTTASFTFSETAKGSYCVTCVAMHQYQSITDVTSISKIVVVER